MAVMSYVEIKLASDVARQMMRQLQRELDRVVDILAIARSQQIKPDVRKLANVGVRGLQAGLSRQAPSYLRPSSAAVVKEWQGF